jgi:hypothetical protein
LKKLKVFIVTGTALFGISALFASKANKQFLHFNTAANSNLTYFFVSNELLFTASTGDNLLQPVVRLVTTSTSHSTIVAIGALIDPFNGNNALMPAYELSR